MSIQSLNSYQGFLAAIGIIVAIAIAFVAYRPGETSKKIDKSKAKNSPHIKAGGNISAGGDIVVGSKTSHTTAEIHTPRSVPEIHVQLSGNGAVFKGHIEKQTPETLVLESVKLNGTSTPYNRQFTKLTFLEDIKYPTSIFTTKLNKIILKVLYRTLNGQVFEYIQKGEQTLRADGKYNIGFGGPPTIRPVTVLTNEQQRLIRLAKKNNGQIHILSTDQYPTGWVRVDTKDLYFESSQLKTESYVSALHSLVDNKYVEHVSGGLYKLTAESWKEV